MCEIAEAWAYQKKGYEHLAQRIRNAKTLRKMGVTFAECRSKANAQTTFAAMFVGLIQEISD